MSSSRQSENIRISDQHAVLLEETLRENRVLREQLAERDQQNAKLISELSSKVDSLRDLVAEKEETTKRKKKGSANRTSIPTSCRTDFRKIYRCLLEEDAAFQGFYLEESTGSTRNKAAFAVVAEAVIDDFGGQDQCPWSPAQLRAAFLTYFRSLKDTLKRKRRSGAANHNTVSRRQGRVREKISRRCSAVDTLDWEEKKKERCKKFLVAEYTSSDESEVSEDENGCNVKRFVVKRLSWESERLRELKDFLDFTYKKSLPPHVRHFQTERVVGERSSSKRPPANAPKWTLKNESPKPLATSTPLRERRH